MLTLERILPNWRSYFSLVPCAHLQFFAQEKTVFRAFSQGTKNCVVVGSPPPLFTAAGTPRGPFRAAAACPRPVWTHQTGQSFNSFLALCQSCQYCKYGSLLKGVKKGTLGSKCYLLYPICPELYPLSIPAGTDVRLRTY